MLSFMSKMLHFNEKIFKISYKSILTRFYSYSVYFHKLKNDFSFIYFHTYCNKTNVRIGKYSYFIGSHLSLNLGNSSIFKSTKDENSIFLCIHLTTLKLRKYSLEISLSQNANNSLCSLIILVQN
jgi:hypothetical protein